MTALDMLTIAAVAGVSGFVAAIASDWRGWRDLIQDFRRHGRENHPCNEPECCP